LNNGKRSRIARLARYSALTTTSLGLVWAAGSYGCSSDESKPTGLGVPDPGGTFGVEANVTVRGGGRVVSEPSTVECPGNCSHRFILEPGSEAATKGVKLTASTVTGSGWRFNGWQFETIPIPASGRGPDSCQPITRPSSVPPGFDANNPVLTLPAGEVSGTPPVGQEAVCGSFTRVPIGYVVAANFVRDDSQLDAGQDSGGGEIPIFASPTNAVGKKLFYKSSRLFWQYDIGAGSYIASGDSPASSTPGTPQVLVGNGVNALTAFNLSVQSSYLVYQIGGGLFTMSYSGTSPTQTAAPPTCSAVAADSSYAYCRVSPGTSVARWSLGSSSTPSTVFGSIPAGTDLAVSSSSGYIAYSDPAAGSVYAGLNSFTIDAGAPAQPPIATGQATPGDVQVTSTYAVWINSGGTPSIQSAFLTGGAGTVNAIASKAGLKAFALDSTSATTVYYLVAPSGGTASIERASITGGTAPVVVKSGIGGNPVAIAVDTTYVYWLTADGKVFRAPR
jgi:hypothetical protein